MQEWAGRTIGSYRIESALGTGGMGRVYRAVHVHLNRAVALKVLHEHLAFDETFQARFLREAQAVAALSHPNIVDILDFSHEQGLYYLVMELVPDGSLKSLLRDGPIPLDLGIDLVRQAAEGLDYAHRQGMVHRDIKPDNLLLRRDPVTGALIVKITDFGLARMTSGSTLTVTGQVMGTPAYMSPEQCQGLDLDGRSDLYSLGVVLFEVATGAVPFSSRSVSDAVYKHVYSPPPDPRSLRPDLPPQLAQIILRCLAKNPAERFATGRDLAIALASYPQMPAQPVVAPPPAHAPNATTRVVPQQSAVSQPTRASVPPPRPPRPVAPYPAPESRRPGWVVPLVALALALLLVASGAALFLSGDDDPPPATSTPEQPALVATDTPDATTPTLEVIVTDPTPTEESVPEPTPTEDVAPEPTPTEAETQPTPTEAVAPTATPVQPTPTPEPDPEPVQMIAFAGGRNVTDPAGILDILTMEADGSNQQVLISEPDDDWLPQVSPDGTHIVWVSRQHGNHQIYIADIDGSDIRRLTTSNVDDLYPTWSSDNRTILFVRSDGDDELFLIDAFDGTERQITQNNRYDGYAAWAPDGQRVAWSSGEDGVNQIYVMNVFDPGATPQQVTTNAAFNYQPAWSPDGTRIAFVSNQGGNNTIFAIDAAGGTPQQLTAAATNDSWPVWSPDGTRIAFMRVTGGAADLVLMDAGGGNELVLATNASDDDPDIRWSPDSTLIAYLSEQDGNFDIWLVDVATRETLQLTDHPGNDKGISWFLRSGE
jgi:Tol biopolymer transport system component